VDDNRHSSAIVALSRSVSLDTGGALTWSVPGWRCRAPRGAKDRPTPRCGLGAGSPFLRVNCLLVRGEWFRAFGEIPGLTWSPLVPVEVARLPGSQAKPVEDAYGIRWVLPGGGQVSPTNILATPAMAQLSSGRDRAEATTAEEVARTTCEALSLPGERRDYHSILWDGWRTLWTCRRDDLRAFRWIEALCQADIALIELDPGLVFDDSSEERDALRVAPPYRQLSALYQREGAIAAGVAIERRCEDIGGPAPLGDIVERYDQLRNEYGR